MKKVKLIECPRDAMQGWSKMIPTSQKIEYINSLLRVGFDTIDFGSFVSPKSVPQMADTQRVLDGLEIGTTKTKLLAIVANARGAREAALRDEITHLGFPFSISETFQFRNTRSTITESYSRVRDIRDICVTKGKKLVIYISMAFGNPYDDPYSEDVVLEWVQRMAALGIGIISLADTVGIATAEQISTVAKSVITQSPGIEVGAHLHSSPGGWRPKIDAALTAGCTRIDGALRGVGGCPMAGDNLVGNMDTELLIPYFESLGILTDTLNREALAESIDLAMKIFE